MASNDAYLKLVSMTSALTRDATPEPARDEGWQREGEPCQFGSTVDDERVDAALDQSLALARDVELDATGLDLLQSARSFADQLPASDTKEMLQESCDRLAVRLTAADPLAWIDALPVPHERPPTHPGEHVSTWRLLLHAWRLWRWRRRERAAELNFSREVHAEFMQNIANDEPLPRYCHVATQRVRMRMTDECPHCGQIGHLLDYTDIKELLASTMPPSVRPPQSGRRRD